MEVDDPGGSISVHAVGGIWGLLALGVFGQFQRPVLNVAGDSLPSTMNGIASGQWLAQLIGVATLLGFVLPLTYGVNLAAQPLLSLPRVGRGRAPGHGPS